MKKIITTAFLIYLCCFASVVAYAQIYPVSASLNTPRPHSSSLHAFTNPSLGMSMTNQLDLNLILNDLNEPDVMVGLEVEFNSENLSFVSNAGSYPQIFNLFPGQPLTLNNRDLSSYFDPSNLQGYNLETFFASDGLLPEGTYEVCFTAFEVSTNSQFSNKACSIMFIEVHDPPEIIQQIGETEVQFPQSVMFSWQPLHFGIFPVQYTLEVWEKDPMLSMDQTVLNTFPAYTKVTNARTEWIDATDLPLNLGQSYYVRVTIRDIVNGPFGPPVYIFKNSGHSPIEEFIYGTAQNDSNLICPAPEDCDYVMDEINDVYVFWNGGDPPLINFDPPVEDEETLPSGQDDNLPSGMENDTDDNDLINVSTGLSGVGLGISSSEQEEADPLAYRVYWKEVGTDAWDVVETSELWLLIEGLQNGVDYDCYVEALCDFEAVSGEPFIISMPERDPPREYYCGQPPLDYETDNMTPIDDVKVGDTIIAYDLRIIVSKIDNFSGGNLSGEGFFPAPMLKSIKIAVTFNGLFVNDESRVVSGDVITKFDPTGSNIMDADAIMDLLGNDDYDIEEVEIDGVIVGEPTINEDGQVVVYIEGQTDPIYFDQPIIITDTEGNSYQISGGYVMPIIEIENVDKFLQGYTFDWEAHPQMRYGFDPPKSEIENEYEVIDEKQIPYKAISIGGSDKISGSFDFPDPADTESLIFVTEDGVVLEHTISGNSVDVSLVGLDEGLKKVYAFIQGKGAVHALNLWSSYLTNYNVHFVPINDCISASDIEKEFDNIEKILEQGVVKFNFDVLDVGLTDSDSDGINADKDLLTTYSEDMDRVISTFTDLHPAEEFHFYVFLADNLKEPYNGYMPRGKAGGFVDITDETWGRIAAHEIGHGAFTLEHLDEIYDISMLDNLMDGSGKTELFYKQWKKMHNQDIVISWLTGTKSNASVDLNLKAECLPYQATNIVEHKIFKTPNNKIITLTPDDIPKSFLAKDSHEDLLVGSLISFTRNGETYTSHWNGYSFLGYINNEGEVINGTSGSDPNAKVVVINLEPCSIVVNGDTEPNITSCACDPADENLQNVYVEFKTNENNPMSEQSRTKWHDVILSWNALPGAKDYYIKMNVIEGGSGSFGPVKYSTISSEFKGDEPKEGVACKNLKLLDYSGFNLRKDGKFSYEIAVVEDSNKEYNEFLYKYSGESGKFYYNYKEAEATVDQSICEGEIAGIGVGFMYNGIEDPCAIMGQIDEVDPGAYSFEWQEKNKISFPTMDCPPHEYFSKGSVTEQGYYHLVRNADLVGDKTITAGAISGLAPLGWVKDNAEIYVEMKSGPCGQELITTLNYEDETYGNNDDIWLKDQNVHRFSLGGVPEDIQILWQFEGKNDETSVFLNEGSQFVINPDNDKIVDLNLFQLFYEEIILYARDENSNLLYQAELNPINFPYKTMYVQDRDAEDPSKRRAYRGETLYMVNNRRLLAEYDWGVP